MPEDAPAMPAESFAEPDADACKPRAKEARAKITNHVDLLPNLDGRSAAARRFRDLVSAFVADQGGLDEISEVRLGLLRRLAATTVCSELIEAAMVNGAKPNVTELCALANVSVKLSSRLGLDRRLKDVGGPSLGAMLKADLDKKRRRQRRRLEATAAP